MKQKYGRAVDGVLVETFTPQVDPQSGQPFPIDACFHPTVAAQFEPIDDDIDVGAQRDARGNWTNS